MTIRRIILIPILAGILLMTTGCVYWRLYQFRNQLSSFPEHFRIVQTDQPTLVALNPILMPDDFGWLSGLDPSHIEDHGPNRLQVYHFEKMQAGASEEGDEYDIVLPMRFHDNRLIVFKFPARFEDVLTERVFNEVFGPMRDGSIERRHQATGWIWEEHKILIPDKTDVIRYLGEPFERQRGSDDVILTYRYRLKNVESTANNPEETDLWMRITTGGEEQKVVTFESYIGRLSVLVDLSGEENEVKIRRL